MEKTILAGLAGVLVAVAQGQARACEMVPLATPARFETVADRQPTLAWSGDAGQRYRVQLAAVLPEGRVLASHDIEVAGASFRLPAPLPAERSAVKVLVSRGCTKLDSQDLHAQGAWFFVDMRDACVIDGDTLARTPAGLAWSRAAGASVYSLRVFAPGAQPGQQLVPLYQTDLQDAQWVFAPELAWRTRNAQQLVATVQPICNGVPGRPVAVPLAGP